MASSLAPEDVLKKIEDEKNKNKKYEEELIQAAIRAERERQLLQKKVFANANPSPIMIAFIVVGVIAILYLVYMIFLRPCMSGEWVDLDGNVWQLSHNRVSGKFNIRINGEYAGMGKVIDNYVQIGKRVGVWNYDRVIAFVDGWQLERVGN
jgi:hypothetical protein